MARAPEPPPRSARRLVTAHPGALPAHLALSAACGARIITAPPPQNQALRKGTRPKAWSSQAAEVGLEPGTPRCTLADVFGSGPSLGIGLRLEPKTEGPPPRMGAQGVGYS